MKSWEVLKQASDGVGVKALASKLKLSPALVYKWCQEHSRDDPDSSGARNPLDRLAEIVEVTGDIGVVNWLCNGAGGFFVKSPGTRSDCPETEMLKTTQVLVQEFGELLSAVSQSIADDGQIEASEADLIRQRWEALKGSSEGFVVACEAGCYYDDDEKS